LAFEDIFISQLPLVFLRQRFYELVTVVAFLHKHHFAHRDIKPENIRLEHTGKLILIDFDTCCRRECDRYFTRPTCSIHTRAPELEGRTEREISYAANACDIFATGCVLFAMAMNAKLPFPVGPRRLDAIRNFQVSPRLIHRIGEQGANMIKQMLQEDPKVRPSADTILQNNFFHPDIKTKTPEPLLPLMESLSTLPLTLVEPLD
jgi:serine/threonine protein kinase